MTNVATRRVPPATTPAPPSRPRTSDESTRTGTVLALGVVAMGALTGAILGLVAGGGEEHDRAA